MMWFLIILGVTIWWMLGKKNRRKLHQIAKELPTSIPPVPLLGQAYMYLGTNEDRMTAFKKFGRATIDQGGVMAVWQASQLYIYVADAEDGETLLKSCLAKDENTIRFTRVLLGYGSIFAPVSIWRPRRKILAPVFSPKNLNGFVDIFTKQSATMVERLREKVGTGDFSIWKYITTYTFDAVSETTLGVVMNSQKEEYHPILKAFDNATALIAARMCQPWLYPEFIYRLTPSYWECRKSTACVEKFVDEIIKEKRRKLKINGYKSQDSSETKTWTFLDMLIEGSGHDKGYNDVELREETRVIMLAGTDTSAVGASFTLTLLSRYPEIQDAVYKELFEVFGDSDRTLVVEDLAKLKYLEAVIKESLRMYPPVPVIVREVDNDVRLKSGTTLVKGVRIIMNIWGLHRNHRYWGDDADSFRPERFLEGPLKHPAQFFSFSHGNRNCLGYQYAIMSMKTALATILRAYRVLPPSNLDPAHYKDPLPTEYDIMMRHVDNYIVRLEERVSTSS